MKIAILSLLAVLATIIGAAVVVGPGLGQGGSFSLNLKPEPKRTTVRIATLADRGRLIETVSAPGTVEPHTKVDVSAEVSARIEQLPFEEGDRVKKGDLIVKLDDEDLQALLDASNARREGEDARLLAEQARLRGLNNTLNFARKELARKTTLYESGDASRKDLDDATERELDLVSEVDAVNHNISVIESSLAAALADIAQAKDALANTVIVAPMDGVITALHMEIGEQVLGTFNNIGSEIMTIADLSRMILSAEVSEADVAKIAEGQQAKIHINAYRDEVFSGTVTRIALQRSVSGDGTGIFVTEVEIDLQGRRIYSGLVANVDVEIATHEGVVVESQAIVDRMVDDLPDEIRRDHPLVDRSKRTTSVVYRVVDGETVCTPVQVGPSDLTHTMVLKGLAVGEQVVVGPYKVLEKLEQGEKVRDEAEVAADDADEPDDQVTDDAPAASDDGAGARVIIRTEHLRKTYRVGVERIHALQGVDIDIEPNEFVAIMGSSGSGKSTLMNILGCLDQPTSGRYLLDGRDTSRMGPTELAQVRNRQIGFVFQSFELLPRMSALKNVEMPMLYATGGWLTRRKKAKRALERVGLAERIHHRPNQLSGGQKQRVAIARAMLNSPAIVLADEPTGNLDSGTTYEIMALFEQLHDEGQTIIIVTHEDDVAGHCGRIIRLADGYVESDQAVERRLAPAATGASPSC